MRSASSNQQLYFLLTIVFVFISNKSALRAKKRQQKVNDEEKKETEYKVVEYITEYHYLSRTHFLICFSLEKKNHGQPGFDE